MKKAVLRPSADFDISRLDQSFIEAQKCCVKAFPDSCFYYDLPFLSPPVHQPVFIITCETSDTELFVKTIECFAASTGFQILPKIESLPVLSRLDLTAFI